MASSDSDLNRAKRWREAHPELVKAHALKYRPTKIQQRRRSLKKNYNMTDVQFDRMMLKQKSCCAGCFAVPDSGEVLFVDHDHATGKVRGLLCSACNTALGLLMDSPETLRRLAAFIEDTTVNKIEAEVFELDAIVSDDHVLLDGVWLDKIEALITKHEALSAGYRAPKKLGDS